MKDKGLQLKVNATIQTIDLYTKEIKKETKVHNLVVNDGLNRVADLIGGLSSTAFEYIAIGDDNTAVVAGDTDLNGEIDRASVTPTDEGTGILEYDHTFTFSTGESYTITEAGLFDNPTISAGTMLNRLVFAGHSVDETNGLRCIITITVANS